MANRGRPRKNPIVIEEPKKARRTRRVRATLPAGMGQPYGGFPYDEETMALRQEVEKRVLKEQLRRIDQGLSPYDNPPMAVMGTNECAKLAPTLSHTDHLAGHDDDLIKCYKELSDLRSRIDKLEEKVG